MQNKKIIIAGGTGFIGQEICNYFGSNNEIVVLGRQLDHQKTNAFGENLIDQSVQKNLRYLKWDGKSLGDWAPELDGADLLINLAGKTVNCRYNEKNKAEIFSSRINAVKVLGLAIRECTQPPKIMDQCSFSNYLSTRD